MSSIPEEQMAMPAGIDEQQDALNPEQRFAPNLGQHVDSNPEQQFVPSPEQQVRPNPEQQFATNAAHQVDLNPEQQLAPNNSLQEQQFAPNLGRQVDSNPEQQLAPSPEQQVAHILVQQFAPNPEQQVESTPEQELVLRLEQQVGSNQEQQLAASPEQQVAPNTELQVDSNVEQQLAPIPEQQVAHNPVQQLTPNPAYQVDPNTVQHVPPNPDQQKMISTPNQDQYGLQPSEMHHGIVQNDDPIPAPTATVDGDVYHNPTMQAVNDTRFPAAGDESENASANENSEENEIEDMHPKSALDLSDNSAAVVSKTETSEIDRSIEDKIENMEISMPSESERAPDLSRNELVQQESYTTPVDPEQNMEKKVESESLAESQPQNRDTGKSGTFPLPKDANPLDFVTINFFQFKCRFCTASFDRRKTFKKHLTNEHGILPYVCNLCGMGYDHKSDLKDHVKTHREGGGDEDDGRNEETEQNDTYNDGIETQGYSVIQTDSNDNKIHLTKSLHLLAQVSHMQDTRVTSQTTATSVAAGDSSSPLVVKTEPSEDQAVPNKRKRGRPRRLPGVQPTKNKRKGRPPRKIKEVVHKELVARKESTRKPRKSRKQKLLEAEMEEAKAAAICTPLKIEVTKGNYKLRPQSVDFDYSSQLQANTPDPDPHLPFQCRYCHQEFKTKGKKLTHEKLHELEKKEFKCTTCGIGFKTFKEMKKHDDKHFPDEMKCHFCNKLFKLKKSLWEHEETHDKPVVCRWCAAVYDKRQDLDDHERLHFISKKSNTIFECHFCQKICKSRKAWKSHMVSHSNIKAYSCEICGKKYKQQGSYNLHMQRHNNTFYKFTCQYCGKKYGQKALLIIHERSHTNERPFKCTHCDLAYPSKNQLDHHMQRVLGVKHMCSYCGKQLNSRSSLEIHERIHTGNRPLKCEYCDMDFIEASSYKYHVRVLHTGERFECKYCGKQCKARGVLNAHMRVHTGERPFQCKFCNKAFRSGNVLRTHLQGIHLGVRHKCEMCGREFAQTSALNTHKKLVHQGLKWKDIQLQRKVNREARERHDRELIENAVGKKADEIEAPPPHGNTKYEEQLKKAPTGGEALPLPTSAEAALNEIERSMASSMMPQAQPVMAMAPMQVPPSQMVAHTQAAAMVANAQATSMVAAAHAAAMMQPPVRPIVEPDRAAIDVVFPPNMSGTAMYHVL